MNKQLINRVIITAAICGAEVTRKDNRNLPLTAGELAEEALSCEREGASIIHLHVRDEEGRPTQELKYFRAALDAMESRGVTAVIQPSTGGAAGMPAEERMQPLQLNPEMATLDCGTLNFGDTIFVNDRPLMQAFAGEMTKRNILPELECFDAGHISNALRLKKEGLLKGHMHFDFVLGVPGAGRADMRTLQFMIDQIPSDATWTVAGVGRYQLPMALLALAAGGHIRTGFEDNVFYSRGVPAESNAQLVARVSRLVREAGKVPATPDEAREILNISKGE